MHRNSQKRIYLNNTSYFLTCKTKDNHTFFDHMDPVGKVLCEIFMEELAIAKRYHDFHLLAFVLLPDHFHILLKPNNTNISAIMHFIKRHFSRNVNSPHEGADGHPRLHALLNQLAQHKPLHFQWQKSFHDHYIRNEKDFEFHYNYTVNNHLKHGLIEDYPYISINYEEMIEGKKYPE